MRMVFLKGILIGLANIIPGVSGGTMAVMLGIYDRLIKDLCNLNWKTVKRIAYITTQPHVFQSLKKEWLSLDLQFISILSLGALAAIVSLSKLITFFLITHHDPTYGFFFGLVCTSIYVPYKMVSKFNFVAGLTLVLGLLVPIVLEMSQKSEDKVAFIQAKQALKILPPDTDQTPVNSTRQQINPPHISLTYLFFAGVIAISAMILPGISGSFLLILLGVYFHVLKAIYTFQLGTLVVFATGCLVGLLGFVRLLNLLLTNFRNATMTFLCGLMIGSLWNIWPFKQQIILGEKTIFLENILPLQLNNNFWMTIGCWLAATTLVVSFIVIEQQTAHEKKGGKNGKT